MKRLSLLIGLALFLSVCKKEDQKAEDNKQIIGTRYSDSTIHIYSKPGSTKADDKVSIIYALEEVTGLEIVDSPDGKGKKYLKLKTVTGKEGYALAERFVEAIYFSVEEGVPAFKKPTLTAPLQGKMDKGAICFVKEMQGDWANANCNSAKYEYGKKPEDYYDVWVQVTDTKLTKEPMIGQTAMTIRQATKLIADYKSSPSNKTQDEIKKLLEQAIDKQDIFSNYAKELLEKTMGVNDPPKQEENKTTPAEGESKPSG